jgi:hypothetical protein
VVGPPYFIAARLFYAAITHWDKIDGQAALKGVDLLALPMHRFLNAIHYWMLERVENVDVYEYNLTKPPPGTRVTERVIQGELDAFQSLIGGGAGGR